MTVPSEYEALVEALKQTSIPFKEYGWENRPADTHGVVSLDFEAGSLEADDEKADAVYEASVDLFFPRIKNRKALVAEVESVLRTICGSSWNLNSIQYETDSKLFHVEWVCQVMDNPKPEDTSNGDDGEG